MKNTADPVSEPGRSPAKPRAYWAAALAFAGVLLWYSLRGTDWPRVGQILLAARWRYLALAITISTLSLALRALRWRVLLNAKGSVPAGTAFWATAAGYFGNNFLPARAGELVRIWMIRSQGGLPASYVLATALSERVADAVTLVAVAAAVLMGLPAKPSWLAQAARPLALAGLAGLIAIAVLPRLESPGRRIIQRLPLAGAPRERLSAIFESALNGVRAFHDWRRLARFVVFTALIWFLDAAGTVAGARALDIGISLPIAFLLIAGLGLGSALPSTPGYVGIYQFVAVSVLTPFGFSRTASIAYILCAQALTWALVGFWGSIGLWRGRKAAGSLSPLAVRAV